MKIKTKFRWPGFYKVKFTNRKDFPYSHEQMGYRGQWMIAEYKQFAQGNFFWHLYNGRVYIGDDWFDKIIEKRIKNF